MFEGKEIKDMTEEIILVDENDNLIGVGKKMKTHLDGNLHRAFSIFIFNSKNQLLLQQRALSKYHSAGLWTNTCCSHPRPQEDTLLAAHRRLQEEMGFDIDLKEIFTFKYRADLEDGLIEHELDHVIVGYYDKEPIINHVEASDYKFVDLSWLQKDIKENPETYTIWLKICFDKVIKYLKM